MQGKIFGYQFSDPQNTWRSLLEHFMSHTIMQLLILYNFFLPCLQHDVGDFLQPLFVTN